MKIRSQLIIILRFTLMLLSCFCLVHCANEKAPEGGKKDTQAPKPKKLDPPNYSLHFNSRQVEITFNEYIKPTGFAQTLISPPLAKKPDFKVVGKTLVIKFKSPLRDSTTYTINFGDDIKDVNEGNILNNFSYVFSTGSFIDSQKVSGKVLMAKDNSNAEGIILSLYPKDSTDAIKRSRPFYFAKTDKSGNFSIKNIKEGRYLIFALKDANADYLYNQPNEMIGFNDSIVELHDTLTKNLTIYLFSESRGKIQFIEKRSLAPGQIEFVMNRPIKTFKIESDITSNEDFSYYSDKKDTITYWQANYYAKKEHVILTANDTIKDTATIELKYIPKDSSLTNPKYALMIGSQVNAAKVGGQITNISYPQELYTPLKINFSRPVVQINHDKPFRIYEDSVKTDLPTTFAIDPKTKQFITFDFAKKENTGYILEIPDSAFRDIFGSWNKSLTYKFKTNNKDNYGNIQLILKTEHPEKSYIVRLLDANSDLLIKEIRFGGETEKHISVENIPAGNYKIVAIDDVNNNGEWDTGNFKLRIQPERVITFKDTYSLKGGWDVDVEVRL